MLELVNRTKLVRDPLAVDQHILRSLAKAAGGRVHSLDGEPRDLLEDVVSGLRRETGEVGERVDALFGADRLGYGGRCNGGVAWTCSLREAGTGTINAAPAISHERPRKSIISIPLLRSHQCELHL